MSEVFWGVFFVVAVIGLGVAGTATVLKVMEGKAECTANSECGDTQYCGSDLKCHPFPAIEKTVVKNDWTTPAAILGLSIVLAALIMRKRVPRQRKGFY